jgi:DNA replication protein DnaT
MARWIKIETHTPDKAEIRQIARLCHCTKAEAFLAFFRVFVWLDEETDDGHVEFFTAEDADDIAGLKGFGEALQEVGWIMFSPRGAVVSNWDRHNGQSAKRRCLDAERKRAVRSESGQMSASETDTLRTR